MTSSVLFSLQQTFILGSQKSWWGLKPSAEEKQRYQKLYGRLSWASHLQVAKSMFVIEFSVLGIAFWKLIQSGSLESSGLSLFLKSLKKVLQSIYL